MLSRVFRVAASLVLLSNFAIGDLIPFEMPSLLYDNIPGGQITFNVTDYNHGEPIKTMCSATTPAARPQVTEEYACDNNAFTWAFDGWTSRTNFEIVMLHKVQSDRRGSLLPHRSGTFRLTEGDSLECGAVVCYLLGNNVIESTALVESYEYP